MELTIQGQATFIYTGGKSLVAGLPTVVFVHGASQDHSCWQSQSRWFAHHGYAVLAPDLPGHGRSAGMPLTTVEALADWIIALLDGAAVGPAVVVGHSMGALIALDCAARHAQRIRAAALLGAAVPMQVAPALLDAAKADEQRAMSMINTWSYSPRGQRGESAVPGIWMLAANLRLMQRQKPGVLHTDLAACNAYAGGLEAAARINCPTLILAGARDQMTSPKAARILADSIAGARLALLDNTGHAMIAEQPDAVLDRLGAFIAGLGPPH